MMSGAEDQAPSDYAADKVKKTPKVKSHEDVVDGFAFLAFKNYEDLQRAIRKKKKKIRKVDKKNFFENKVNADVATNTSPLAPKNKVKTLKKRLLLHNKKLMDQENGGHGAGEPPNPHPTTPNAPPKKKKIKTNKLQTQNHMPEAEEPVGQNGGPHPQQNPINNNNNNNNNNNSPKLIPTNGASVVVKNEIEEEVRPPKSPKIETFPCTTPSPPTDLPSAPLPPLPSATSSTATNGHVHTPSSESTAAIIPTTTANTTAPKVNSFFAPYATNAVTRGPEPKSTNSATVFGSIARLLDSPTGTKSNNTAASISSATSSSSSSNRSSPNNPPLLQGVQPPPNSHSPRGHSPSRERESFSSNVSSLSRTSVTPVNGSNPPNHSPQLQSYSKAASWLNSVPSVPPRPTPPPPPQSINSVPQPPPVTSSVASYAHGMFASPQILPPPPPESLYAHHPSIYSGASARDMYFGQYPGLGAAPSSFYQGARPGFSYPTTPFGAPPLQTSQSQPTFPQKKSGRWNAMHVRVAWEIYQHQHKGSNGGKPPPLIKPPDLFRPNMFSSSRPPQVPPPPQSPSMQELLAAQSSYDHHHHHHHHQGGGGQPHPLFQHLRYPPGMQGMQGLFSGASFGGLTNAQSSAIHDHWSRMGRSGLTWDGMMSGGNVSSGSNKRPGSPFRERSPVRGVESSSAAVAAANSSSSSIISSSDKPNNNTTTLSSSSSRISSALPAPPPGASFPGLYPSYPYQRYFGSPAALPPRTLSTSHHPHHQPSTAEDERK